MNVALNALTCFYPLYQIPVITVTTECLSISSFHELFTELFYQATANVSACWKCLNSENCFVGVHTFKGKIIPCFTSEERF